MDKNDQTNNIIHVHMSQITSLNIHSKFWIIVGVVVTGVIIGMIFSWDNIHSGKLLWILISSGLIISCAWWWWVLYLVRLLLSFRMVENAMLLELVNDLKKTDKKVDDTTHFH